MAEGHEIILSNRQNLMLTGVSQVESFDDGQIIVETNMGVLALKGQGLHILQLNLEEGKLAVEGIIRVLEYMDGKNSKQMKGKGLWQRILK